MRKLLLLAGLMSGAMALSPGVVRAQTATAPESMSVTQHRGQFNGQQVAYTAWVEKTRVSDGSDGASADLVSIAYTADVADVADRARRPVIFIFNGGPISPSIYLHMGAFAPMRVAFPDDLRADPASFPLQHNPYTVLDTADLVFFDPAGTGYSRVADGTPTNAYFSVEADARQLAQLITDWSRHHGRLDSPKYLIGESYGTLRAAETARQLTQLETPVRVDGVFLIGQALNIIEMAQRPGNVTSYVVSLPTLAALGWYHGRVEQAGRSFEQFIDESRRFSEEEYLPALFSGGKLAPAERQRVAARLQALTGLSAAVYLAHDLKVSKDLYRVELLKDRGEVLGAYDGRYLGKPEKPGQVPDASTTPLSAIHAGFARYARDFLKIDPALDYRTNSPVTGGLEGWNWGKATSPFGDWPYMRAINDVMERNPDFRVVVAAGYYDTATTIGASEYAIAQSGWPDGRVSMLYYQGGHMPYTIESSLKEMMRDVRTFVSPE